MAILGAFWAPNGTQNEGKKKTNRILALLGAPGPPKGHFWESQGTILGAPWELLGTILGALGAFWDPTGPMLAALG